MSVICELILPSDGCCAETAIPQKNRQRVLPIRRFAGRLFFGRRQIRQNEIVIIAEVTRKVGTCLRLRQSQINPNTEAEIWKTEGLPSRARSLSCGLRCVSFCLLAPVWRHSASARCPAEIPTISPNYPTQLFKS